MNQPLNSNHSLVKFRPVLTLEQIRYITTILIHDSEIENSIRKVLVPMIAKVEVGAINPAYKLSETHALKMQDKKDRERYEDGSMTSEEELEYESKVLGM